MALELGLSGKIDREMVDRVVWGFETENRKKIANNLVYHFRLT